MAYDENSRPAGPVQADDPALPEQPHTVREFGSHTYIVAAVEPLDLDGVRTILVGTALWALAFVMLLPFYSSLEEDGLVWWLWTCAAGFGLGIIGWDHCRRRRARRREQASTG